MTQEQLILFKRSLNIYNTETEAWTALDNLTHTQGQPVVAFFRKPNDTHGDTALGAIFAIGTDNGVGKYKACSSHDDMLAVAQALNTHILEWTEFKTTFDKMFEYDANHEAIKAKLDFYTDSNKNISAGGLGGSGSSSLGALYQLVDVMINSTGDGVEGAVEGSVLAYDATAGKWKAIAQSEILPDMSGYYTKDETNAAINDAKTELQGEIYTLQALIPATATADNQLADKDFVNSSIATATAEFRGSFTSLDALKATSGNLNDYAFYLHTDSVGNSIVDRYKWTTAGWLYEYTLNNSSFTAEQWAALNSAITATLVQSYNNHLKNTTIHITANERTAWDNKWDYNEETIKAVKVNAATSADYATSAGLLKLVANQNPDTSSIGQIFTTSYNEGIPSGGYAHLSGITLASNNDANYKVQLALDYYGKVFSRWQSAGTWRDWNRLAFITDNVASATKLQTPRTIWGKPFDGSADVSGDLIDVGNITASGKATIQGDIVCGGEVAAIVGEGTPAGVTDYSALTGKPSINGVTLLSGNNTLTSLGIQAAGDYATNSGVETLLADYAKKTFVANNYAGKAAFNTHTADTNIHITAEDRVVWNAKWDYNEATIKAVKVTSASSADSVAWSGISGKPTTFTPSAHTHTASDISGLPTNLSAFNNDVGFITGITKSMVEGVLTGDITSHTHTFASLTSKPTTIAGYGITDAITTGNIGSQSVAGLINEVLTDLNNGSYGRIFTMTSGYGSTNGNKPDVEWVTGITLMFAENPQYRTQLAITTNEKIYLRREQQGTWHSWKEIAFTDSNVASATKLATARKIWGLSFDGSANVSGNITGSYFHIEDRASNPYFKLVDSDGQIGYVQLLPQNAGVSIGYAATLPLTVNPSGNVLIGTITDYGYKLQVNGSERVYGDLIVDGEVSALVA